LHRLLLGEPKIWTKDNLVVKLSAAAIFNSGDAQFEPDLGQDGNDNIEVEPTNTASQFLTNAAKNWSTLRDRFFAAPQQQQQQNQTPKLPSPEHDIEDIQPSSPVQVI